jgi:hypothetical protein
MSEQSIDEKISELAKNRNNDAFGMAYKLTETYAGSANANAIQIPGLFKALFTLFETGKA